MLHILISFLLGELSWCPKTLRVAIFNPNVATEGGCKGFGRCPWQTGCLLCPFAGGHSPLSKGQNVSMCQPWHWCWECQRKVGPILKSQPVKGPGGGGRTRYPLLCLRCDDLHQRDRMGSWCQWHHKWFARGCLLEPPLISVFRR